MPNMTWRKMLDGPSPEALCRVRCFMAMAQPVMVPPKKINWIRNARRVATRKPPNVVAFELKKCKTLFFFFVLSVEESRVVDEGETSVFSVAGAFGVVGLIAGTSLSAGCRAGRAVSE